MYFYVNQTNYPHVSYPTMTDIPELERKDSTVRTAGCGLCSASMVVTNLTGKEFSLIDCLELSLAVNANHSPGTDMDRLAPYVAERFDLDLVMTDDPEMLRAHLLRGGMAVAYGAQRGRGRCANLCVAVVQQRDQRVPANQRESVQTGKSSHIHKCSEGEHQCV